MQAFKIILVVLVALLAGCTFQQENLVDEPAPVCFDTTEQISFSGKIQPLINKSCALSGCHGSGSFIFELNNYNDIKLVVAPGNPDGSLIWARIENKTMPPASTTGHIPTDCERKLIEQWIVQGALNN